MEPFKLLGCHTCIRRLEMNDPGEITGRGGSEDGRKGRFGGVAGDEDVHAKFVDEGDDPLRMEAGIRKRQRVGKSVPDRESGLEIRKRANTHFFTTF